MKKKNYDFFSQNQEARIVFCFFFAVALILFNTVEFNIV